MVSDGELVQRLREFLRSSDLNTTTTAIVRRKLESDFGVDLSDKKAFIREQVDLFLHSELNDKKEEEDEDANAGVDGREPSPEEAEEEGEENEGDSGVSDEEEVNDDDDDDGDPKIKNGTTSRKRRLNKVDKDVKKRRGGFTKLCNLSPQLQDFVGESKLARTEVVKKIWAYIRENKLQDPSNKRNIICDEKLHTLFNVNTINMFQMNKALSKHIWPLDSEDGTGTTVKPKPKDKQPKKEKEGKQQKRGSTGLLVPLQLSDDLVKFIGTGEDTLSRSDVIKRMWDYIKQNNLQDPADKRNIICDEKLKELFNVDTFHGFTVSKLLKPHFVKTA